LTRINIQTKTLQKKSRTPALAEPNNYLNTLLWSLSWPEMERKAC